VRFNDFVVVVVVVIVVVAVVALVLIGRRDLDLRGFALNCRWRCLYLRSHGLGLVGRVMSLFV